MEQATVFIVDDNVGVTNSLSWLIESVGYKAVCYNSPQAFLENYNPNELGCLVVDVRMPEMTGPELQEQLLQHSYCIPIIFITAHGDVPIAVRAMQRGAIDFLTKPTNSQLLLEAINKAVRIDQKNRDYMNQSVSIRERVDALTSREKEVMKLVVVGKLTKTIADELSLSMRTVEMHRANIMRKMHVNNQVELAHVVHKYQLLGEEALS